MKITHGLILFTFCFLVGFYTFFFFPFRLPPLIPNNRVALYWCDPALAPEDVTAWVIPLKKELEKRGFVLDYATNHPAHDSAIALYAKTDLDLSFIRTKNIFIWAMESPVSLTQPLPQSVQSRAKKIFTWRRDLVDNKKIFYLPIVSRLTQNIQIDTNPQHKTILLALIGGNYKLDGGIYHLRTQAVLWFLKNHPTDFALYGRGWYAFKDALTPTQKHSFETLYKGIIPDKYTALKPAKFALAYENISHTDYVTEKIYDVMQSGTVPVYFGAPNITDFVPKECFVNKRDFATYDELYAFLKNMPADDYLTYLTCIQNFLSNDKINELTGATSARILADEIFKSQDEK